jgi:hypothetical protein
MRSKEIGAVSPLLLSGLRVNPNCSKGFKVVGVIVPLSLHVDAPADGPQKP